MHWMVLFSHCTVCFPSTLESHSAVLAVCIPAPAFCTKLTVQTNLKGLFKAASLLRQPSCEARGWRGKSGQRVPLAGRSREEFARRDLGLGLTTALDVHWFTLVCWYAEEPMAASADYTNVHELHARNDNKCTQYCSIKCCWMVLCRLRNIVYDLA